MINKIKVKPLVLEKPDPRPVLGSDLFPTLYSNIAIVSRKRSGKTHLVGNILRNCASRKTSVIIICPTINRDLSYKAILTELKKRKINVLTYDDILQSNASILDELIENLQRPDDAAEEPKENTKPTFSDLMFGTKSKKPRPPRTTTSKFQAPDFIVVIDDCSHNLRDPSVSRLVKISRHLHIKLIISTQNTTDISPGTWRNIDSVVVFRGMTVDKLFRMYELLDVHVDFEVFLAMYNAAVSKPFAFLNVDCRLDTYKICFNQEFII